MLPLVGSEVSPVSNFIQQLPTSRNNTQQHTTWCANARNMLGSTILCLVGQQWFKRLHGPLEEEERQTYFKKISKGNGLLGLSILHRLHALYGFDVLRDTVFDVMHLLPLSVVKNKFQVYLLTYLWDSITEIGMTAPVSSDIIIRIHQWFCFIVKTDEVSEIADCILSVSF